MDSEPERFLIAGGGPAGVTAAYELCRRGARPTVFEMNHAVGGHARTEKYRGYRFDIGGHRFFTKFDRIQSIWEEILGDRFRRVSRLSRIYYDGRFFYYPLRLGNVIKGLGVWNSLAILGSYLWARLFPHREEKNFEQWVVNRFGRRLYETFFKTYTEKVWGIPCTEIRADWAAQRIKDLSFTSAVLNAIRSSRGAGSGNGDGVKSLIQEFHYPELGPGQMWEEMSERVVSQGGDVRLQNRVRAVQHQGDRIVALTIEDADGGTYEEECPALISSIPVSEMVRMMEPEAPEEVLEAAASLRYRDFLTVCVVVDDPDLFPDNWIYIHDPQVKMGRLQNFKNWSAQMVPDPNTTSLGAEYFVNHDEELWNKPDEELVEMTSMELETLGLTRKERLVDGVVYRQRKAYPIYDATYAAHLEILRNFLAGFENLETVGRNGLHRYNNQDHSMLTALLAVDNFFGGDHDVWSVNTERSYHEEAVEEDALDAEEVEEWTAAAAAGRETAHVAAGRSSGPAIPGLSSAGDAEAKDAANEY